MVLLKIDRECAMPVYRQIIRQITELIENETLEYGSVLPSSRELAKKLGLNRSTVYRAYMELGALGYVKSDPGSYTRVRKRPKLVSGIQKSRKCAVNWSGKSNAASRYLFNVFRSYFPEGTKGLSPEVINLSPLDLDHRIFPVDDFKRCMNQVLTNEGSKILRYGEYAGYRELREVIAHRMQIHGISVSPGEILITNGAQQAIELILKLLAIPGAKAVIEKPTYANVIPLMRHHQVDIIGVPMRDDGMDLKHLNRRLEKNHPAFVYTIPNFQNPTGVTSSQANREALLSLCEKHKVPVVEDGFEEEMKYFGKVVLPIKSMDRGQVVIYLGTFSKVLFPGIRIGWIAAEEECIERLTAIKRFIDLSSSTVIQAAVAAFCRQGYYDLHIKRMHRFFRKRMETALKALGENLPASAIWTKPDGGYTIWVSSKSSYEDEMSLKKLLLKHRVMVSPGDYYFHGSNPHRHFRISIASLDENEIREGIIRLGKALTELNPNEC